MTTFHTPPEVNKIADGQSRSTVGLGIADRLRAWIPDGDGYNSEYANTLAEAADEIERLRNVFRVNILRLAPETPHDEIDRVLNGEPDH